MQIEALGKREGPTESDLRSNFRILDKTIKESMAGPGDLVVDKETGTYMYSRSVKPEIRAKIEQARLDGFKELVETYTQADGTVPESVARVLISFGVKVDKNGRPQFSAGREKPETGGGTPTPAAAPAPKPAAAATTQLPTPKTQEEYDAIPAGTDYIDRDGKRKTKSAQ